MVRTQSRAHQSRAAPARICIGFLDWPAADQAAWNAACKAAPLFESGGAGADWRPASRDALVANYGRWLGFLKLRGWLHATEAPAGRLNRDRVQAFVTYLQEDRASVTVAGYISLLVMALNGMCPEEDWDWMRAARANLQALAVPLRSKADRVEDSWELVQLGFDLMAEAETLPDLAKAAALYRDGLIIALLALRPFRRRNFLGMVIGRHLLRAGDSWRFAFAAEETKGKRAIEKSFPASLVAPMKRYLEVHRPKLLTACKGSGSADRGEVPLRLWVSNYGNPLSLSGFGTHIGQHTCERFGWAIDPHSFRHCLATTLAKDNPEAVWLAMCILDHTDFAITDRYYIVAQREAAHQCYAALLENLRKGLVGGRRSDHPALLALSNDLITSRSGQQSQW